MKKAVTYSRVKLGTLTKIKTGKLDANANDPNGQYPFFTCAREPLKINSFSYDCECVLVAGNGDLNVKYYFGKFDAYQRTYIIEAINGDVLSPRFLYYFMEKHVETLRKQAIGGVIKYIKLENLTEAIIPLPPLETQQKIAAVLDKAQELIDKRKEQIAKLDEFVQSVFYDMFGNPIDNQKGLEQVLLSKFIVHMTSGGRGWAKYYSENGDRFIRSLDVQMNRISDVDAVYVIPPEGKESIRTRVKDGDVLLTITGSCIGRVARIPENFGVAYVSQHVAIIRTKGINPIYLAYYLSMPNGGQLFINQQQYGQTKPGLNLKQIESLPILGASHILQNDFAQIFDKTEQQKALMQQSLAEMENNFNSLMQRAFRGEMF